jgi:polyhydroxyalkanoate synthesis regulator phasin
MGDVFDRIINAGFGMASYSREKIEEAVEKLVEKGEIAKEDAEKTINEIIEQGRKEKDKMKDMISKEIEKQLAKYDYVKKSEIENIISQELAKKTEGSDTK